jgi:PAS domain S-box-containing protein
VSIDSFTPIPYPLVPSVVHPEDLPRAVQASKRDANERSLRLIINGIPGFIYTMTARGEVELVNDPTLQYFGRSLEELKDWAMTDAVHPDDLPRVAAKWGRAVESGEDYEVEQRLRGANGVYRWFHGKSLAVRDVEGRVVGWYGLLTDIDDRKRAERRLRRAARTRYEAAIAERARIARDMHDGLLQDITGIALKVAGVLPHIRSSPEVAEQRMELLLESIQRTNRAAREAVVGMRRDANSADVVSAVQGEAQRLTTQAKLALSTRVSGSVRLVPAVVRDVALALVHEAVTNVVKHARASGVKVSVAFSGNRLRLTVRDDGVGLTLPADPRIEASHFGLAGMRERAASIGGTLLVSSVPGQGTTIRLGVPLRRG